MANEPIKQSTLKKKKKKWISIYGTKDFKDANLGESYVTDSNMLMNKHLEVNLMELTNDIKKQNIKARFKITSVSENRAMAELIGYELVGSLVRRIVKRARSKIDDSFEVRTKDDVRVRVKPIVLTKTLGPHSMLTLLRSRIREFIIAHFKKFTFDELIHQLINVEIQRSLKDNLKKIHPISVVEIRYLRKL